jgi:hypothetical protein
VDDLSVNNGSRGETSGPVDYVEDDFGAGGATYRIKYSCAR